MCVQDIAHFFVCHKVFWNNVVLGQLVCIGWWVNGAAYSQELIHQEEFWEGLSGNEEKSLTFQSFPLINDTISLLFHVFVCYMLQEYILRRRETENLLSGKQQL